MKPIKGYNKAQVYDGGFETIPAGGHVCRIVGANVEENQYVAGNPEQIVLAIEINEGTNLDGYYGRRYEAAKKKNPSGAKWMGTWSTFLLNREGTCSSFFKGMTTAVEESNEGYKWNWDEKTLCDKWIGVIFREEEYVGNDGKVKTACKPFQIRSVEAIRLGVEVPEKKLLDSGKKAKSYFGNKLEEVNVDDDELPF